MTRYAMMLLFFCTVVDMGIAGDEPKETPNTLQSFSGKIGFYSPSGGLNNGLLMGVDGITEFTRYSIFLSGDADLYYKKSINIYDSPQADGSPPPDVTDQQIVILPVHVNLGYRIADIADADTKIYAGVGGGYAFYFYSVNYQGSSGGLLGGPLIPQSATVNGGAAFGSAFLRVLVNKIFIEPRYYWASAVHAKTGTYALTIQPTGYAVTFGFQYH